MFLLVESGTLAWASSAAVPAELFKDVGALAEVIIP